MDRQNLLVKDTLQKKRKHYHSPNTQSDFHQAREFDLQHVFISRDRIIKEHQLLPREAQYRAQQNAEKILKQFRKNKINPANSLSASDLFLNGYHFESLSTQEYARYFGDNFSRDLNTLLDTTDNKHSQWLGPVASIYGYHLIWLDNIQSAKAKSFAELTPFLTNKWRKEQEAIALQNLKTLLRSKYTVNTQYEENKGGAQ